MNGHVRKRGKKWYYSFEVGIKNGVRKRIVRVGGNTKKEAQEALRKTLNEYECGFIEPNDMKLDTFIDEWFKLHVEGKLKTSTRIRYQSLLDKYIRPALGQHRLQKITPILIEQMLNSYRSTNISSTTLQHIYSILNNIYNRALKMRVVSWNPCKFVDRPKRVKHESNVLSVKEFYSIIDLLDISLYRDYIFSIALHLELELGLRRGELASIEWNNIDLNNNILSIENNLVYVDGHTYMTTPKSIESTRKLYFSDDLKKLLLSYKSIQSQNKLFYGSLCGKNHYNDRDYDFVLTWKSGKGIHPLYFTKKFGKLIKESSIEKRIRFHDLRHTNATLLVSQGVDFKTIQRRLGHADINTTLNIYSHVSMDMQKKAVTKLSAHINGNKMATN